MNRLIVVSNRGLTIEKTAYGNKVQPAAGGVAQAIHDALLSTGGEWISLKGGDLNDPNSPYETAIAKEGPITHRVLTFNRTINAGHYKYKNSTSWPANHDDASKVTYNCMDHACHMYVIPYLADEIVHIARPGDFILLEDYQLGQLPKELRDKGLTNFLSYFHHTPVASQDTLDKVHPHVANLQTLDMKALLNCDLVGFQTGFAVKEFLTTALGKKHGFKIPEVGEIIEVPGNNRTVKVMNNPIGVDANNLLERVGQSELSDGLKEFLQPKLVSPVLLYSGGERRDPAKGRLNTIRALRRAFELDPDMIGNVQFVYVSIPTRMEVSAYSRYSEELLTAIKDLNDEYRTADYEPVVLVENAQSNIDCVHMSSMKGLVHPETNKPYRVGTLVSGFADGMNLTILEGACGQGEKPGVLIMSENIGAASLIGEQNITFDPFDVNSQAAAIRRAYKEMSSDAALPELKKRHQETMRIVEKNSIQTWLKNRITPLVGESFQPSSPKPGPAETGIQRPDVAPS